MANTIDLDFFEKILIQNCLKKDTTYISSIIDHVDKTLFKNKDIGNIIEIIRAFYLEHTAIPTLTEIAARINSNNLRESFENVVKELRKLDREYNEAELIKNTESFLKQRKFGLLMEKTIEKKVLDKEYDVEDFQTESEKIHTISLIDNLGLDFFEDVPRVKEYLGKTDSLISTGYKSLDEAFGGGFFLEGKAIYDIGGETNVGKSIFLANIAVNVILQNYNVVIISPEMSEMRYAKRISSILTGMAINSLKDNLDNWESVVNEYKNKISSRLVIKEVPTKGVSAKHIFSYLTKLKNRKGFVPNLICIDGHALLKSSVNKVNKYEELQHIVQECRGLSYMFPASVLTVAQLNRSSHKASNPGLESMGGSWDQLADLDGHVNIWQTDEDREANMIRFSGKKVRDGSKGNEGHLFIDYETLRLTDEESMLPVYVNNNNIPISSIEDILKFDSLE